MRVNEAELSSLIQRIENYALDEPEHPIPFSARLCCAHGWSADYAARVIREYRRFVILAMAADHVVSPSPDVDKVWHEHILDTRRYWEEFCDDVLGAPLHHTPSRGGREEAARFRHLYDQTLDSYRAVFGREPPTEVWPAAPDGRRPGNGLSALRWARRAGAVLKPTSVFGLALLTAGCAAIYDSATPGALQGPEFLRLYLPAALCAVVLMAAVQRLLVSPMPASRAPREPLGSYELAYLNGGASRVLAAALLRLKQADCIQLDEKRKRLRPGPNTLNDLAPVERGVLSAVREDKFKGVSSIADSIATLRQKLLGAGLLPNNGDRWRVWLTALVVAAPIIGLGVLRLFHGMGNHRAVGWLCVALVVQLFAVPVLTLSAISPRRYAAPLLQTEKDALGSARRSADDPLVFRAVALFGFSVLASGAFADMRSYIAQLQDSSSSSGCGGGGGCGGGCGG